MLIFDKYIFMPAFLFQLIAWDIRNPVLAPNLQALASPWDYFNNIFPTLFRIGFIIGGVVFIFVFIVGAFQWITAGGDKGQLEDARRRISHAIVGLVVLLLIYLITQFVNYILGLNIGLLGGPPGTPPTPTPTGGWCVCSGGNPVPGQNYCNQSLGPCCTSPDICVCSSSCGGLPPLPTSTPIPSPVPTLPYPPVPNIATGRSCNDICSNDYHQMCLKIGTPLGGDRTYYDYSGGVCTLPTSADRGCAEIMDNDSGTCSSSAAEWTNCSCRSGTLLDAIVMDNSGTSEFFSESVPLGSNGLPSFPSPRVWNGPYSLLQVCPQCVGHGSVVGLHGYVVPW